MYLKKKAKASSKKDGFTLIEVVAALAIVSILAAVLVPKVSKYIEEAKKTKALEEVRQVVLAVEDYNISSKNIIGEGARFSTIKTTIGNDVVDLKSINAIKDSMRYKTMEDLVNGKKNFELIDGKIEITS